MRQINLIPYESRPDRKVSLAVNKSEKILIILLLVYALIAGAALGATYYLKSKLNKLTQEKQSLSADLTSLSSVENSTVYVRDRVSKYNQLGDINIAMKNYADFNKTFNVFPSDAKVDTVSIKDNAITYKVNVNGVQSFSDVLNRLVDSQIYKDISLSGITYNDGEGYSFILSMNF